MPNWPPPQLLFPLFPLDPTPDAAGLALGRALREGEVDALASGLGDTEAGGLGVAGLTGLGLGLGLGDTAPYKGREQVDVDTAMEGGIPASIRQLDVRRGTKRWAENLLLAKFGRTHFFFAGKHAYLSNSSGRVFNIKKKRSCTMFCEHCSHKKKVPKI